VHPITPPRRRGRRTVLIIVAVVGVLCLCAGGIAFGAYKLLSSASAEPRAAVHAFVGDLAAGDTDAAYEKLCEKSQAGYSRSEFASLVAGQPRPTKATINGFSIQDGTARIDTTLAFADGRTRAHPFDLVKEAGAWRVCGNPY
jgi:hypothetical protein